MNNREKRAEIWRFLKELVVGVAKATQPSSQAAFFKCVREGGEGLAWNVVLG